MKNNNNNNNNNQLTISNNFLKICKRKVGKKFCSDFQEVGK